MLPPADADDRPGGDAPGLGRGVDIDVDGDQPAALSVEPAQQRRELGNVRREVAQARDDERLGLLVGELLERPRQRRARLAAAGLNVVHDRRQAQASLSQYAVTASLCLCSSPFDTLATQT